VQFRRPTHLLGYERVFTRKAKGELRARPRWFQRPSNEAQEICRLSLKGSTSLASRLAWQPRPEPGFGHLASAHCFRFQLHNFRTVVEGHLEV